MNIIEDIRDALLHTVENRSPPPRTPMDLWTVLKDEWCELPPRPSDISQVHATSRCGTSVCALHDFRQVYQFFWLFSVH
ncbi:hypothetical protein AVEN_195071-1 [Araneus ventricosus]|uniref:Uncharacterized protein n=1 Tax=Araneus ventricosus TaxID=182803 RepID=A0A4Y2BIS2_ARAVE|nr:hypothetical protein AVEN_195071-1 [Araneus ventricosus]